MRDLADAERNLGLLEIAEAAVQPRLAQRRLHRLRFMAEQPIELRARAMDRVGDPLGCERRQMKMLLDVAIRGLQPVGCQLYTSPSPPA